MIQSTFPESRSVYKHVFTCGNECYLMAKILRLVLRRQQIPAVGYSKVVSYWITLLPGEFKVLRIDHPACRQWLRQCEYYIHTWFYETVNGALFDHKKTPTVDVTITSWGSSQLARSHVVQQKHRKEKRIISNHGNFRINSI